MKGGGNLKENQARKEGLAGREAWPEGGLGLERGLGREGSLVGRCGLARVEGLTGNGRPLERERLAGQVGDEGAVGMAGSLHGKAKPCGAGRKGPAGNFFCPAGHEDPMCP